MAELTPALRSAALQAVQQLQLIDHVYALGTVPERRRAAYCRQVAAELQAELDRAAVLQLTETTRRARADHL